MIWGENPLFLETIIYYMSYKKGIVGGIFREQTFRVYSFKNTHSFPVISLFFFVPPEVLSVSKTLMFWANDGTWFRQCFRVLDVFLLFKQCLVMYI